MIKLRFSNPMHVALLLVLAACQGQATTPAVPATTISTTISAMPPTGKVIAEWNINLAESFTFGFGSVWVMSHGAPNVVTRIDPVSNKVTAVITGDGFFPGQALVVGDSIWVAGIAGGSLAPIDPETNIVGTKVTGDHRRIAYGFNSIWAVARVGDPLDRVDPATGKVIVSIPLGASITDPITKDTVQVSNSGVWVMANGELIKIDPSTNTISLRTTLDMALEEAKTQTKVPAGKGTDFIWMVVTDGLLRIDPSTGVGLTFLPMSVEQAWGSPSYGYSASDTGYFYPVTAITDDSVWVLGLGQINQVNVATNHIDATYMTHDKGPADLGLGFGSVWIAYRGTNLVQRLDLVP